VPRYYQNAPHVMAAALAWLTGATPADAVVVLHALWFAGIPLALFVGMRRMGFHSYAAALAGLLSLFVDCETRQKHLFGLAQRSFTWDGWGLYTMACGAFWFCLCWGYVYTWLVEGRGYWAASLLLALTWLSHTMIGYGASTLALVLLLLPGARSGAGVLRYLALQLSLVRSLCSFSVQSFSCSRSRAVVLLATPTCICRTITQS
jgi:hypothetical protein